MKRSKELCFISWLPKSQWTALLQSVFVGKAQDLYMSLPVSECSDYEKVKSAILKGYELVPEAYRLRFRNKKKVDNQSYMEFAKEKADLFSRWCESENVNDSYELLCQLVLVEEFKRCVPDKLKVYLSEQGVTDLDKAARLAEEYSLIHKMTNNEGQRTNNYVKSNNSPHSTPPTGKVNDSVKNTTSPNQSP